MNLTVQSCSFNNYTNNKKYNIGFRSVVQTIESKTATKINNKTLKASLLILGASVLKLFSSNEKEVNKQDLIDADVKEIISNYKDVVYISKKMKKDLREKDKTKGHRIKEERKAANSISRKVKNLMSKNLNLILQNEKYSDLPKGYHYRIKSGLYYLLEKNPNAFTLNEDIIDWKIDQLREVDKLF